MAQVTPGHAGGGYGDVFRPVDGGADEYFAVELGLAHGRHTGIPGHRRDYGVEAGPAAGDCALPPQSLLGIQLDQQRIRHPDPACDLGARYRTRRVEWTA